METYELVKMDSCKSANNRIFYAVEKCIKALLATQQMDVETHELLLLTWVKATAQSGAFT